MNLSKYDIIIAPVITEKATRLKDEERTVVFYVHPSANKIQIKKAVEELFNVKVERVRTVTLKGKPVRYGRFESRKPKKKKAYVKLKEGEKMIEFFEGV